MSETPRRILIVDDESSIRNILNLTLQGHGYEIQFAETGANGLALAAQWLPHLMILDLGLPDMNGLEVLRRIRSWSSLAVLVLTVDDNESRKVELLDAGADDYLTKPFGSGELVARVRVALRHLDKTDSTPVFSSGALRVDLTQRQVFVSERAVKLTATEFELLSQLVRSPGRVIPQGQLLSQVWGPNAIDQTHYLRIYIAQLRKKLEANPAEPKHILTEPGVGYRIV